MAVGHLDVIIKDLEPQAGMFECGPYGAYVISRYDRWDPASQQATFYYTLSNGSCSDDNSEPRYQVHLMKSSLRLINIG